MNNGKIAIVTGSSRGIGRAAAIRLAADGFSVIVNYAGNAAKARETVAEIISANGVASAFQADIGEEGEVAALFEHAEKMYGGVDVVVNAAGIMVTATIADLKFEDFDRMHKTNVRGAFLVAQQAAKRLRQGGAIINISTSAGKMAMPGYAPYTATKAAVDAMTLVLARELRGRDITVNTVAPGPTATELFFNGKDKATIERLAKLSPLERLGQPDDIADIISFLAGPARWINGQILYANGGAA